MGERGPQPATTTAPPAQDAPAEVKQRAPRTCDATQGNPGGTNNYIPDAPARDSLGSGFVTGLVRSTAGCRPLEGVRVQVWLATVWLATQSGGEQDNRASVRPAPTVATGSRPTPRCRSSASPTSWSPAR